MSIANKYITNGSKNNTYWYPTRFGAYFSNIELKFSNLLVCLYEI